MERFWQAGPVRKDIRGASRKGCSPRLPKLAFLFTSPTTLKWAMALSRSAGANQACNGVRWTRAPGWPRILNAVDSCAGKPAVGGVMVQSLDHCPAENKVKERRFTLRIRRIFLSQHRAPLRPSRFQSPSQLAQPTLA